MQHTTKTRTQRRLEKKQAIFLLILVLVVSLCSFVVGIMLGRRGAERDYLAQLEQQQEAVRIVQAPVVSVVEPVVLPPAASVAGETAEAEPPRLSFYEDLVRETAPLGSGINQPPPPAAVPPLDLPPQPVVVRESPTPVAAAVAPAVTTSVAAVSSTTPLPPVSPSGSHAVQVGSFAAIRDAAALRQKMLDGNYPAFLAEADLKERGIWYRVRIGPYADADTAAVVQKILQDREKIEGFVTRHTP